MRDTEDRAVPAAIMNPTFVLYQPIASITKPYATRGASGTNPAAMRQAYGIKLAAFGTVAGDGSGQTIAIVDAYNEPTIASDLAAFDANFGLSAPPSFKVVNQTGGSSLPPADSRGGWGVEIALDVEWAHVVAPRANLLLVEANTPSYSDLMTAVDTARNNSGVGVVSMSWGGNEWAGCASNDPTFTAPSGHDGVTFVASSGDSGAAPGASYPAVSPNVVGVGGTTLLFSSGVGSTWSLTASTSGLAAGTYTFYAVATDARGISSAVCSTTLTVAAKVNPNSTSSLSCSVAYFNNCDYVTLTVNVSVAPGQPPPTGNVFFYLYGQPVGNAKITPTSGGATATINVTLAGHGYAGFSTYYAGDSNCNGSSSTLNRYI